MEDLGSRSKYHVAMELGKWKWKPRGFAQSITLERTKFVTAFAKVASVTYRAQKKEQL